MMNYDEIKSQWDAFHLAHITSAWRQRHNSRATTNGDASNASNVSNAHSPPFMQRWLHHRCDDATSRRCCVVTVKVARKVAQAECVPLRRRSVMCLVRPLIATLSLQLSPSPCLIKLSRSIGAKMALLAIHRCSPSIDYCLDPI